MSESNSRMDACAKEEAVYASPYTCLAFCAGLEPGDALSPPGHTLACRAEQATLAKAAPANHCKFAGPGGNGG